VHDLARWLMAREHGGSELHALRISAGPRACEKLAAQLQRFVGISRSYDLISRAIILANEEAHWLRGVKVGANGAIEGFTENARLLDDAEAEKGGEDILAELLGLLITFVGQAQTMHLLEHGWPDVRLTLGSSDAEENLAHSIPINAYCEENEEAVNIAPMEYACD
jgi:hypothetical protein